MKRSIRILALCLAILCVLPLSAGAAAPQTMDLDAAWFEGDTSLYHHGLAQASMILATAAYNENTAAVLSSAGFKNINNHTPAKHLDLTLLNYTTATAKIGGRTVISVVFQDAKNGDQFQSIADFDGRKRGFSNYQNSEIAALLASANTALNTISSIITDDCCVWISGYGYGGGAAELLAAMLNGEEFELGNTTCRYTTDADVRCYAFGTPAVSTQADGGDYDNIFIINNPEDLLVYLPGEKWGYRHFGQVIEMNTFNGDSQATAGQKDLIGTETEDGLYYDYCGSKFYVYPHGPADVHNIVAHIYQNIAVDLRAYYDTPHTVKISPELSIDNLFNLMIYSKAETTSKTCYEIITEALSILSGSDDSDMQIRMAVGTYLHGEKADSPYHKVLEFALTHALHTEGIADIVGLYTNIQNGVVPEMYELICAHTPSCYLAWMMATNRLTELSGATTMALERWMEIAVSGENITYSASIPGSDTLWLAVYNSSGKMLKVTSLGNGLIEEATISVPNAASASLFLLDSHHCPVTAAETYPTAE